MVTPPKASPAPKYHHGDLAAALLAQAYHQVQTLGAEAVSLRAVAQAVGVSPSAAYHHFPDKTALLNAVGEQANAEFDRRCLAAVRGVPGVDPQSAVARLWSMGEAYIDFAQAEPHLFRHIFGSQCTLNMDDESELESQAYTLLSEVLDELAALNLVRCREGLDLLAWTAVHGFASLMLEDHLPRSGSVLLQQTLLQLILKDPALALPPNGLPQGTPDHQG